VLGSLFQNFHRSIFLKHFILLLVAFSLASCGKDENNALTAPTPENKPAPEAKTEPAPTPAPEAAPAIAEEPVLGEGDPEEVLPEPNPSIKEMGQAFGIPFYADAKCEVEDLGNAVSFRFGDKKVVTLHEDGLMTAHDSKGKEWLHEKGIKQLFVLRGNVGFLNSKGLFRYVWVGHHEITTFLNAKKITVDEEGFLIEGAAKGVTFLSAYRWDGAAIVNNFRNAASVDFKSDAVTVTFQNKTYKYGRTKVK